METPSTVVTTTRAPVVLKKYYFYFYSYYYYYLYKIHTVHKMPTVHATAIRKVRSILQCGIVLS